jgi:hypothetical protein
MTKYIKKLIAVEVYQWSGESDFNPAPNFRPEIDYPLCGLEYGNAYLSTAEGWIELKMGSYIVKGPAGEYWAVRKDIFENTYEKVED